MGWLLNVFFSFFLSLWEKLFKCMAKYIEQKDLWHGRYIQDTQKSLHISSTDHLSFLCSCIVYTTYILTFFFFFFCGTLNRNFSSYFSQVCQSSFIVCLSIILRNPLTLDSFKFSCISYKSTEVVLFKCKSLINLVLICVRQGIMCIFPQK